MRALAAEFVGTALLLAAVVGSGIMGEHLAGGNAPQVRAAENGTVVRGADELFWVPTLEQAIEMGKATGRPIFLMGYSLVPNGSTYTKLGADYCSGVF